MFNTLITFIQIFFTFVIGMYFFNMLKSQHSGKSAIERESQKELEKIYKMRSLSLTEPLSEKTRPKRMDEIIGQEQGIRALRSAICSPNPQHVIIYGPPGVGKTAVARVVLEEAKNLHWSPFKKDAKFIEINATTLRFDERGIADPLIGSVHDPIYQGAGAYGIAGIPQPKMGAVSKAHGGILFIDEIGELHPMQMNKLLKVLEDRKVFFESAYYCVEDKATPPHIHDIFKNGIPADFRLIGATTVSPDEISPAIRSRCVEIFFRPLFNDELAKIAVNATIKSDVKMDSGLESFIAGYAANGREAVNIVQIAAGLACVENRSNITKKDIEWIVEFGNYTMKAEKKICPGNRIGQVNGLAVYGANNGMVIDIECISIPAKDKKGNLVITGVIENEEVEGRGRKFSRKSCVKASIENVLTVLEKHLDIDYKAYDIHINFVGGVPIDGPSAGIAIATAVYSSIKEKTIDSSLAITGEISIFGLIKPVGGVRAKIEAAKNAGIKKVIIPKENWQEVYSEHKLEIVAVESIKEVIAEVFEKRKQGIEIISQSPLKDVLSAKGI